MRRREVALRDGRRVWLRPLAPGDAERLAAVYASLDAADQRRRFSCAGLSPADLRELAAGELLRAELGVLAVCDEGGAPRPVAAGLCARDDGGYELAVTVAPGFRGASLDRGLLDALRTAEQRAASDAGNVFRDNGGHGGCAHSSLPDRRRIVRAGGRPGSPDVINHSREPWVRTTAAVIIGYPSGITVVPVDPTTPHPRLVNFRTR